MSPTDTVSLLNHGRLFRDAIKISRLFDLCFEPVFASLTLTCIEADKSDDKTVHWNWLVENGVLSMYSFLNGRPNFGVV